MGVGLPENAAQVEERIKADVAREAPDSNPYLRVHWLRSFIAGVARRIFDLYRDLNRTEQRLLPDTADDETAPRWGNIYVGPPNESTPAGGLIVGTGTPGGVVPVNEVLTAAGQEYRTTTGGTVQNVTLGINSISRSGSTATVITSSDHGLASFIPATITGATEPEYNVSDAEIVVTGLDSFQYQVEGSPATPATGAAQVSFTSVNVEIEATTFGESTNLDSDTELRLQSPIADVADSFFVTFGEVGGGTDAESTPDYKARYLDKIRNPVAHFNAADIKAKAKEVNGVTRVFVEESGTEVGTVVVSTLTRIDNVAKAVTATPHGFEDGNRTTVNGADQPEYNVENTAIIVADALTFYYLVAGTPATPATGTINAATVIPLGQVRTFFMRDNDPDPIPSASEVLDVKEKLETIRPANTSQANNIVSAPVAVPVSYTFNALTPNTTTMRAAVEANLGQFHAEETSVSQPVTADQYRAAIQNTVDPSTGDVLQSFDLASPAGDIAVASGQIATLGAVTFP